MSGEVLKGDVQRRRDDDPGYIVAWKYKYKFEAGKNADMVMSYGAAKQRAAELAAQHPERTFWAERLADSPHVGAAA
jgi:hypothetical protein